MNLDRVIKIRVSGRNISNYVKRMVKRNIKYIKLDFISDNEIQVVLEYNNYLELIKYKSILYNIEIVDNVGIFKIREKISKYKVFLVIFIMGIFLLYMLSYMIFKVEVIHENKEIRELVLDEVYKYGIRKYSFKKKYEVIEKIEDSILDNNKDKLEWIEISVDGTFITVRVEERLINNDNNSYKYQNIISKKNSVVRKINAVSGEVMVEKDIYVKKGDVLISGNIIRPDGTNSIGMASGEVLGDVWYEVEVFYPFVYQESLFTGRKWNGVTINFFGREFNLFSKSNYRTFSRKNKILFEDNLLDIEVIWDKRYELSIKDEVYTAELVESKASDYVVDKIKNLNSDVCEVVDIKLLSRDVRFDGINFNFFVTTLENIGEVEVIDENKETIE